MMARSKDPFLRNQLFTSTKLSKPRLAVVFSQHYIVSQPKIRSGQHNLQNNQRKINRKTILKKNCRASPMPPMFMFTRINLPSSLPSTTTPWTWWTWTWCVFFKELIKQHNKIMQRIQYPNGPDSRNLVLLSIYPKLAPTQMYFELQCTILSISSTTMQ